MAEGARPALGLSIGATNLAAVTADHSITRKPVLTLYRQRPPEVGVPSENPRLDEPGLVITEFVDRVGDPVGIVAADGSMHRSEALVADGLRALAYTATGGHALPENVTVTYPAHWGSAAVDALGAALSRVAEWSNRARPLTLIPDAAAALIAARANPGIPARGVVAVCDFGGSGTSITLVDAAAEYQPLAGTVRHHDFSGGLIDQALLTYVMGELPNTGAFDPAGTSAIGSLARLRAECRAAKEQLSSSTVTTLSELPQAHGGIRITRTELDDVMHDSLNNFMLVLEEMLARNAIRAADLAAVVSVGGGANIPAVTTMLSGHFRIPVVTAPRPQLTAAIGGALRAARGPADASATRLTPAPAAAGASKASAARQAGVDHARAPLPAREAYQHAHGAAPASVMQPALAWSEADDASRAVPSGDGSGLTSARPQLTFERESTPGSNAAKPKQPILPWYRLPAVIIISTAVAVVLVGAAVAIGLSSDNKPTAPSPGVSSTPAPAPSGAPPASNGEVPAPAPASQQPTSPPSPTDTSPPPATTAETPPASSAVPPASSAVPQAPVTQQQAPAPISPPAVPAIPQIPGLPQIPGINAPGLTPPGAVSLPAIAGLKASVRH
ncbi:MAG: Hsp70 family protein [Mycobacterium sp.]|uniref:Hsp70 family protein n=1 Tax=Mycobacterium sp. TaxID=1785 RepID=UPI001EB3A6BA|nr:Hsp70 family protein [Mycobacterium sp.]MBW0016636.1 Hsp70 family protein [Mycobacterium sp.]